MANFKTLPGPERILALAYIVKVEDLVECRIEQLDFVLANTDQSSTCVSSCEDARHELQLIHSALIDVRKLLK